MARSATSGVYLFLPGAEEQYDPQKPNHRDEKIDEMKRDLDEVLKLSRENIERVTGKALRLHGRIRRRPQSVRQMKVVLKSTPPSEPTGNGGNEDA